MVSEQAIFQNKCCPLYSSIPMVKQVNGRLIYSVATMDLANQVEESKMESPREMCLRDYKMPDYYFDTVDLKINLGEERTIVSSKISMLPCIEGSSPQRLLDGRDVSVSVQINGKASEDDLTTLGAEGDKKELISRKRKREELSGMVNWMRNVAKNPLDPLTQPIPEPSKWKECKGPESFIQILRAREALLIKQHAEPNSGPSSVQKPKMHPSMYDDPVTIVQHAKKKMRCSERQSTFVKSHLCSCCNSCPANGATLGSSVIIEAGKCPVEKKTERLDLLYEEKTMAEQSEDDSHEKEVLIGPRHQAEVEEWTGEVYESDSKWLGTPLWPLKHESDPVGETDIGRGRLETCSCQFQGSVECIRFHIAENRMKLKRELGDVFFRLGFDRMGEEVSLQWTPEEEKKFKDIMRSDIPDKNKVFWNHASKHFRKRTRRHLVSYYFNVFLIQLRSYQNRVTPKDVDSDDDEAEFGCLSDGFGMEALKGPGIDFLECSENKQCTDFSDLE